MLAGEPYTVSAPEIQADRAAARGRGRRASKRRTYRSNGDIDSFKSASPQSRRTRWSVLPPSHFDYGFNISLGAGVFLNFNCIIVDVTSVELDDISRTVTGMHVVAAHLPRDGQFGH
ncbi:hypothetical protein C5O80_08300 [Burkholderia sp. SRS-46]|nr:hypothetical protein C5O80_08300 [Burkholderia sp. SRS-46]